MSGQRGAFLLWGERHPGRARSGCCVACCLARVGNSCHHLTLLQTHSPVFIHALQKFSALHEKLLVGHHELLCDLVHALIRWRQMTCVDLPGWML